MKRVFIVHGWDGYPEEGWFPWLKKELEATGFEVIVPQLPDAATPRIHNWVPKLQEVASTPDENMYFVGHSMGCQTIARYLEALPEGVQVGGAVFVAGFFKRLTNIGSDDAEQSVQKEWMTTPLSLEKVKTHLPKSVAIFSDNDPFVPLDNVDDYRDKLGSKIIILSGRGHFSGSTNQCLELPEVLEAVLKLN